MTPDRSGLWYFRRTADSPHDRVARVQFFTPEAEKLDRPVPGCVARVGLMGGDILRDLDLGPDGEWLGPVPPSRPEPGDPRRAAAHALLDRLHDRGLDEAVAVLEGMIASHAEDPTPDSTRTGHPDQA